MSVLVPEPLVLSPSGSSLTQDQAMELMTSGNWLDAFGRWRTSQVVSLFDSLNQYSTGPRNWATQLTGTGAVTHLPLEAAAQLSTGGGASGASAVRQTRICWRYQPGRGQLIYRTFLFGEAVTNVRRRIGYFNANDGIFLEQTDSGLRWVQRTSTSGSPSDALFANQADWNLDRLDGTGPSGKTLDITKAQLLFIDFQWLGVGRARMGFFIDGIPITTHEFDNGNVLTLAFMATANLPLREEITNTDAAAGTSTMKSICSAVFTEGGDEAFQRGHLNSASNGTTTVAVTTRRPVLSVRPAATFGGITNDAWYILIEALFRVTSNDIYWEVVFGASLTGPSWSAAFADSCVEFDVSATALSGGASVVKGFGISGQGSSSGVNVATVAGRFPNSRNSLTGAQEGHTLVATSFSGTANVSAAVNWREIY